MSEQFPYGMGDYIAKNDTDGEEDRDTDDYSVGYQYGYNGWAFFSHGKSHDWFRGVEAGAAQRYKDMLGGNE